MALPDINAVKMLKGGNFPGFIIVCHEIFPELLVRILNSASSVREVSLREASPWCSPIDGLAIMDPGWWGASLLRFLMKLLRHFSAVADVSAGSGFGCISSIFDSR